MAQVVLVHGIAQEQIGADRLEGEWTTDLASGVRATRRPGAHEVADRLVRSWRHGDGGALTVRMAFYGDLFLDETAQGPNASLRGLSTEQIAVAEALATEWLARAASRSGHPDRDRAAMELRSLEAAPGDQGLHHRTAASAIRAASRVPWLAYLGMGVAQSCVNHSLRQLTAYLTDPILRVRAQDRIHEWVGNETEVIVSHSLGTIVAFEYLHAHPEVKLRLLLTLGSPLSLRSIVYERLTRRTYPDNVALWVNLADRNDLVAADPDLLPGFGEGADGRLRSTLTVDNGAKPHEARFYLTKAQTASPLLDILETTDFRGR
ncbi:hypothetical protein [Cellulomonas cellasea]|uniref:Alpha/beta hydrolase n=2 Tax=Cellulomonas cellasea TaxID=43670 RepID=A0A0A0B7T9_9CELL|nr:hypothetical protein [Cellulomonas cellasea]KGM02920.1 hypothetical protein Q760_10580 [Cellulomonas cellasea DSM 20118]GEA89727.1 hypothetical protein CCE01nite_36760 [Cellulomonas cellasea]